MAQHRSLGILPRDLDKRARLSEQERDQNRASLRLPCNSEQAPSPLGRGLG